MVAVYFTGFLEFFFDNPKAGIRGAMQVLKDDIRTEVRKAAKDEFDFIKSLETA